MTPYYQHGGITIYHGEALSVLGDLPTGCADALMTDPPYSSGGAFRTDRVKPPDEKYRGWSQNDDGSSRIPTSEYGSFGGDNKDQRSFLMWSSLWASEALRVCRAGSQGFCFTDWRQFPATSDALQMGGWTWRGALVWDKGVGRPNRGQFRNHLEYALWASHGSIEKVDAYPSVLISVPTVSHSERQHVTQKPVELIQKMLVLYRASGVVLDPFMGSGSTLVAVSQLGWSGIGIERDERYCEMAARRIGQQEVLPLEQPA